MFKPPDQALALCEVTQRQNWTVVIRDVKNIQLGFSVAGVLFTGEPDFIELLHKAIILQLKMLTIFIMFSFPSLNSVIPIDPSRSINFRK